MKIIKSYKKKKGNMYEITFLDNEKLNLYDDIILKYDLLLNKEIDDKKFEDIIKDNSYLESYFIAIKYITSKLRTKKEIRKKLSNYNKEIVDYTLNRLEKEGYLNDELYIKAYINDSINLKLIGQNKIIHELKLLGFNESDIDNYLKTIDNDIWLNKIDNYIKKKIDTNRNLSALLLKQKLIKDLYSKGFYQEDINLILVKYEFVDNESIYEKEYDKLKNKLIKKYSGEELDLQIRMRLYKKGFRK